MTAYTWPNLLIRRSFVITACLTEKKGERLLGRLSMIDIRYYNIIYLWDKSFERKERERLLFILFKYLHVEIILRMRAFSIAYFVNLRDGHRVGYGNIVDWPKVSVTWSGTRWEWDPGRRIDITHRNRGPSIYQANWNCYPSIVYYFYFFHFLESASDVHWRLPSRKCQTIFPYFW